MTNLTTLQPKSKPKRLQNQPRNLDTYAQLRKRRNRRGYTVSKIKTLTVLESQLHRSYLSTLSCNQVINQEGGKLVSSYCNQRWCSVCNAIRTAKLIDGYETVLMELPDPRFVTLTRPNVRAHQLAEEVGDLAKTFRRIRDRLRKQGIKLVGVRATEVTHNNKRDDYHPHYHMVVSGELEANALVREWLRSNPKARISGQDNRPADANSMKELFKYCTKMDDNTAEQSDVIYCALYGKRLIQTFGGIKRVSEDIEELQSTSFYDDQRTDTWVWQDEAQDWVSITDGAFLCEYAEMLEARSP